MKILSWKDHGFLKAVEAVCQRATQQNAKVEQAVRAILDAVRQEGDKAVQRFTWRFDEIGRAHV